MIARTFRVKFYHPLMGIFKPESLGIIFLLLLCFPLSPVLYFIICAALSWGFPHSSVGKESTYNAGDPGLIPGSGRSTGEGIGYPLQCSWASFVAQRVKNPPATWETWIQSLGWEDPLKKGKAANSSILACIVHGVAKSRARLSDFHYAFHPHPFKI